MIRNIFPIVNSLKGYHNSLFKLDVLAGLTIGVVLIPQAMAYALLAGIPPIYGLYGALIPIIIYAFLGTSNYLSVGPVAITAILMFSGVSNLASPFSEDYVNLIIALGLFVGVFQLLLSAFKIGKLTKFLPKVVLSAFVHAAAILIIISQIKNASGIVVPNNLSSIESFGYIFQNTHDTNLLTFLFFLVSLLFILVLNQKFKNIPSALLTIIIATFLTYYFRLDKEGLVIIGSIPEGLPMFRLPNIDRNSFISLLPSILTVTFIGFVGSIGLAKSYEENQIYHKINSNRELLALGFSKLVGSFFQAMPSTGSFSRSSIGFVAGAKTQVASLVAGLLILLTLLFMTPVFYFLPNAILAAIIVQSVFSLLNLSYLKELWHTNKFNFVVFITTFFATIILGLEAGIILGFVLYYLLKYLTNDLLKKKKNETYDT